MKHKISLIHHIMRAQKQIYPRILLFGVLVLMQVASTIEASFADDVSTVNSALSSLNTSVSSLPNVGSGLDARGNMGVILSTIFGSDTKIKSSFLPVNGASAWTVNGTNLYVGDTSLNVGIGTSTPRSKFDVWGGDLVVTGTDMNGTAYVTSRGGVAYYGNNSYSNGIAVVSNGSVGIGTASPTEKFSISNGNASFDAGHGITWNANSDGAFIKFKTTGDDAGLSYLEIGTVDNNDEPIIFTQTGNERMRIGINGGINISTSLTVPNINGGTPITSSNIGSQSVNYATTSGYATSAGNADTVDGYHATGLAKYFGNWTNIGVNGTNDAPAGSLGALDGYSSGVPNFPITSYNVPLITVGDSSRGMQIGKDYADSRVFYRNGADGWGSWSQFITSNNISFQSVNYATTSGYATSAGNADTVDGIHAAGFVQFNQWQSGHKSDTNGGEYARGFYDTDDETYYTDPNGTSRLSRVYTTITYDINDENYYSDPNGSSRLNEIRANSATVGGATVLTTANNIAPVYQTTIFGTNGTPPVRTSSNSPINIGYVYGPFGYATPSCPVANRYYKLYTEFVDNITSGGQTAYFRIAMDGGTNLDFNMGSTWGANPAYRTYLSDYFQYSGGNHAQMQAWINGSNGPYVELRKAELWMYCR